MPSGIWSGFFDRFSGQGTGNDFPPPFSDSDTDPQSPFNEMNRVMAEVDQLMSMFRGGFGFQFGGESGEEEGGIHQPWMDTFHSTEPKDGRSLRQQFLKDSREPSVEDSTVREAPQSSPFGFGLRTPDWHRRGMTPKDECLDERIQQDPNLLGEIMRNFSEPAERHQSPTLPQSNGFHFQMRSSRSFSSNGVRTTVTDSVGPDGCRVSTRTTCNVDGDRCHTIREEHHRDGTVTRTESGDPIHDTPLLTNPNSGMSFDFFRPNHPDSFHANPQTKHNPLALRLWDTDNATNPSYTKSWWKFW